MNWACAMEAGDGRDVAMVDISFTRCETSLDN